MRGRGWLIALLAGLAAVVAAACAPMDARSSADMPTWEVAPSQADVVAVHPGPDDHSLVMDLRLWAGAPDCGSDPRLGYHTYENGRVYANVVVDAPGTLVHGRCPEEKKVTVTLTFDYAVAGKPLITNSSQVWEPGTPDYQLCAPRLGCHPPADHCAREWIAETVYGLDTPQHSFVSTVHCDQTWLVLEINRNAAVCGAGGRPGCSAPPDTTRYFLRWETHGWRVLAGSRDAGCPTVVASEPGFPVQLCDLPAPS